MIDYVGFVMMFDDLWWFMFEFSDDLWWFLLDFDDLWWYDDMRWTMIQHLLIVGGRDAYDAVLKLLCLRYEYDKSYDSTWYYYGWGCNGFNSGFDHDFFSVSGISAMFEIGLGNTREWSPNGGI